MTDTPFADTSPRLHLPYLLANQAQKHVTLNEALTRLDALVQLAVESRSADAPPEEPEDGGVWIIAAGASGDWAGRDGQIAARQDGGWRFLAPQPGWAAFVLDEGGFAVWTGSDWAAAAPLPEALQNLSRLGIGTSADAANPFAARLNTALWTALPAADGGTGDLRYTLNKESAGNVLSLLLQSGWSGRAEIGLTGDDTLRFRVSEDGSVWRDGIVVAPETGQVSFPHGVDGIRERLGAARTYYVRPDGSDANTGLANTAAGAFATVQKAFDVVFSGLDLGTHDVTIQLADGTYTAGATAAGPRTGTGDVILRGNAASPGNVIISAASVACIRAMYGAALTVRDMTLETSAAGVNCLMAAFNGVIQFANLRFGACAGLHMRAEMNGIVQGVAGASYQITGGALVHYSAALNGNIRIQNTSVTLTGTPAFTTAFAFGLLGGCISVNGNTYTGAATGSRYVLSGNAVINTNSAGASFLPGNAAGSAASGGQYL
ncbi:DUF2793 domain-containing protein [Hyphomonas sp.]|uniref:DUF2793 domain-containing protein n=1 Tax=Hyphomonas sp. TaxID=87 RepID=UPI00391C0E63